MSFRGFHAGRFALAVLCVAGVTACEQADQRLPFEVGVGVVTRPVTAAGTTISSAAGAAFHLPAGALAGGTALSLEVLPAPAAGPWGTPAAGHAFRLDAGGAVPSAPVRAELRIGRADPRAWLAAVVLADGDGAHAIGEASGDLGAGILHARLPALGTVAAVLPAGDAVIGVEQLGTGAAASRTAREQGAAPAAGDGVATRAVRGDCGSVGRRCTGLDLRVAESLLRHSSGAAVLFPSVSGELRLDGAAPTGSLLLDAPLRLRLASGKQFVTLAVRVTTTATATTTVTGSPGAVGLSDMRVRVESSHGAVEETMPLVIEYEGEVARLRLRHSLGASLGGVTGSHDFEVVVPLRRVF